MWEENFMRQTALLAISFLMGLPAFAVDPQLLNLVMPDARIMAGMNVTNARNSAFGQFILRQIPAGEQSLQNLISVTGFDPRQDLSEILMASPAQQGSHTALVLARGNFDIGKITAALKGQQTQTYNGATLISPMNTKDHGAIAFLNGSIAIAGDAASVKAALDRQNNANSLDPALAAKVQSLSTAEDAWSVSIASLGSLIPAGAAANTSSNQITSILKDVQSSSGGVKFADQTVNITGQAIANTPENAGALGDVIRLIVTLVSTNAGANAQAAAAAQFLQSLQITTDGNAVNLALTVPESQFEAFLTTAGSVPGLHAGAAAGAVRR
jgi:hypothetical protein